MPRLLALSALFLIATLSACDRPEPLLNPTQVIPAKPGFLGDPPGPEAPQCDACVSTDLWCENWEWSCHLAEWNQPLSPNLTRTTSEKYAGGWGAKHDFHISSAPTVKTFGGTTREVVMQLACKFAPDFFNQALQGGKHWIRLKGAQNGPADGFELDTDFRRIAGTVPFIRFFFKTPQAGGGLWEWPLVEGNIGFLTLLEPYRGKWGYFRFEIKLNTPGQSNGYFRFFVWNDTNGGFWEPGVFFENANIVGNNPSISTYFDEFHWSNYDNPPPNEGAYWFSDELRILAP